MPIILSHTDAEISERKRSVTSADIFVHESVISEMIEHTDAYAKMKKEAMGLLIGHIYSDERGEYTIVSGSATSDLLSDEISVKFDHKNMSGLFNSLDDAGADTLIVGWYHSHLGLGCFMSETDVCSHVSIFGKCRGVSIVLDPEMEELKAFVGSEDGISDATMVVVEDQTHIA